MKSTLSHGVYPVNIFGHVVIWMPYIVLSLPATLGIYMTFCYYFLTWDIQQYLNS